MVKLGQKVRDLVSGFEGIAVAKHSYLQGCSRVTVQPVIDKDGKLPETATFDEPQLVAIGAGIHVDTLGKDDTGGPSRFEDNRRY